MKNPKENSIIIFDEVSVARIKETNLFQEFYVNVYGAAKEDDLFNLLSDEDIEVSLIIMDIGMNEEKGFDILNKIKLKKPSVPILILTANNKKQTFTRCIEEGVAGYILKPVENAYLLEKVLSIINTTKRVNGIPLKIEEDIRIDIKSFINTEITKAKKGKYEITLILASFFVLSDEPSIKNEKNIALAARLLYEKLSSMLWETDIVEKYGPQTYLGFFPFCGKDNSTKVINKIYEAFEEVKKDNVQLKYFKLGVGDLTFPTDEDDKELFMEELEKKMHQDIVKGSEIV